jgi:asparaginyl-tRNA synthetase
MYVEAGGLGALVGSEALMRGWIASKRIAGKVIFLTLRDGSGSAQLVCERGVLPDADFDALKRASVETPAFASGSVVVPEGREIPELNVSSIKLLPSEPDFPIGRKEHGPDFLMDQRHLWLRSPRQAAYLRVRSSLEYACAEFLHREGFHRFDAPLITPNACEGTTELFELDYFGESAYLSQSGQLYSEAASTETSEASPQLPPANPRRGAAPS